MRVPKELEERTRGGGRKRERKRERERAGGEMKNCNTINKLGDNI